MGSVVASSINILEVDGETLVWHTGLPGEGEHRTSPPFSYGGREWCLRFSHRRDAGFYHIIRLHLLDSEGKIEEKAEDLTDPFRVHVQMQHLTQGDKVVGDVEDSNVCTKSEWLWGSRGRGDSDEAIFRRLDGLRDLPEVKFACRFPAPPTIIPTDKHKGMESLKDEIKTLQKTVQQQALESENYKKIAEGRKRQLEENRTFISRLKKDKDKEVEHLKYRIKTLQKTVTQHGLESENFKKIADECKRQSEEKTTFISRFEKDKVMLFEEVESLKDEIKTFQKTVQQQGLESENYEKKINDLQKEKLSTADELEEKMTLILRLEKDKDELVEEVESLKDEINTLQKTVQQQGLESENYEKKIIALQKENLSIADELEEKMTFISRLEKACLEHELHKKETESLLDQVKTLQTTVENNRTPPEKPTSPAGIELISDGEHTERQDESTIASGLEKAAFGGEAAEENNMDGEKGESGNGKKVKKQSRVKSTPKISLPARHDDVICNLKSVLASGSRSDFTLKSGGCKKWAVHRVVLEGRSGHLDALLRGAEIRLDDVTDDAMDGLVRFLYAGEVGRSGNVNEILAEAHELNLGDLESLCVDCLGEWMCPELVCAALVAARALKVGGDLEARALDCYFRERSRVHATEGWKDLKENHPGIVADLFQEFVKKFGKDDKTSVCAERDSPSS